jgi:hypothetical protein
LDCELIIIDLCIGVYEDKCIVVGRACYLEITTESTILGEWWDWWENFNGGILLCMSIVFWILCLGLVVTYVPCIELGLIALFCIILWFWIFGERTLVSIGLNGWNIFAGNGLITWGVAIYR